MAGPTIDSSGITIQSFDEILAELVAGYQAIYGVDINLSQESPDGQRVAIEAKSRADMQAFGLMIANNFDPDFARGIFQAKIAKLSGIFPRPATRSFWDLSVVSTRVVTLPTGYQVSDNLGQLWELPAPVTLPVGTTAITFQAAEFGSVTGLAGAVFTPVTVVLGIAGFTAAVNAEPGKEEETDEEFVQKRNLSLENPAFSTTNSLAARLLNNAGVTDARVYDNDSDAYDLINKLDAHSIWAVVEGGTIDDIMQTLLYQKTGGTGIKGSIQAAIPETLTRSDGSTFIVSQIRRFDRPVMTNLYVTLTAKRKNTLVPIDLLLIKQKIAGYKFYIGSPITASEVYGQAYKAGDDFILTLMKISTDNINFTDGSLTPLPGAKFEILISNITITELV
jgi:uncharacterized phage protein gp47/JayE